MDKITETQRSSTRNQSTVDYQTANLFMWNNRYQTATLNVATTGVITTGMLVIRGANPGEITIATEAAADLEKVIGILAPGSDIDVEAGDLVPVNYCISGDIDTTLLELTDPAILDLLLPNGKAFRDILTDLGFVLHEVKEQSDFDN